MQVLGRYLSSSYLTWAVAVSLSEWHLSAFLCMDCSILDKCRCTVVRRDSLFQWLAHRLDTVGAPSRSPWPGWCSHLCSRSECWLWLALSCFPLQGLVLAPKSHWTQDIPRRLLPMCKLHCPGWGCVQQITVWMSSSPSLRAFCGIRMRQDSAETTSPLGVFPAFPCSLTLNRFYPQVLS